MKKCTMCLIEKDECNFYKKRNGLESYCKKCRNEKRKKLHNSNPEKYKAYKREISKKRRLEKPEEYKKWRKEYQEKNREKIRLQVHENYLKNKEHVLSRTKKWRQEHKEEFKEMWIKSIEKDPMKRKARRYLNHAIEYGKIIKPLECSLCKENKKLQAHHEDYARPLEVIWMCSSCHAYIHSRFK